MASKGTSKEKEKVIRKWKINKKQEKKPKIIDTFNRKIDNKSQFSITELAAITIITAFISFLMGLVVSNSSIGTNDYKSVSPAMQDFLENYTQIINNYYGDVDEEDVLNKALQSVIDSLGDPYTEVVDDSLANSLATRLQGTYKGFGIEVINDKDNNIYIANVLEDSPASKAGLKSNDKIIAMDDKSLLKTPTDEFATLVRNSDKESITLTIVRDSKEMKIDVKREKVTLKSISSKTIDKANKKIGYIYINVFAANTDVQFIDTLEELEDEGIDSLIIDLRDNTGGHLSSVENIMSDFFDKSHVIYQIKDKSKTTKYYSTGDKTREYPIAVLVNGNSASASELLTAALKEEYGATVVGKTTYGKGTVQEVQTTNTGIEYKLTTKQWLTPEGNWINEVGIEPDIDIELSKNYFTNPSDDSDNQLQAAIEELIK